VNNDDISGALQELGISWDAQVTFLKETMATSGLEQTKVEQSRFWLSITYRLYAVSISADSNELGYLNPFLDLC